MNDDLPSSGPEPRPADPIPDAVERVAASVVALVAPRRGLSSAFAWRPGALLTAACAVGRADAVDVVVADGRTLAGRVRGRDRATDLAVVAIDDASVETAPPARRDTPPRVGEAVFAVGREADGAVHASFGRVGASGPAWTTWCGGRIDARVRLDGGLFPGLTGAPVADAAGGVVGLASPALSRHHAVVLPWATIDRVAAALWSGGRVDRGYLGIAAQPVGAGAGSAAGLLVAGLDADGPAARAGLLVGDIIVAADGQPLADMHALRARLSAQPAGTPLTLRMSRGGQPVDVAVAPAQRPARHCH